LNSDEGYDHCCPYHVAMFASLAFAPLHSFEETLNFFTMNFRKKTENYYSHSPDYTRTPCQKVKNTRVEPPVNSLSINVAITAPLADAACILVLSSIGV
jgi:hypothetical protein